MIRNALASKERCIEKRNTMDAQLRISNENIAYFRKGDPRIG
jgi:hypothetical protein